MENVAENVIFLNDSSNTTVERDATQWYVWSICCFREMINGISLTIIFIFLLMTLNRKNVKNSVLAVRFHRNFWKNFHGKSAVSELITDYCGSKKGNRSIKKHSLGILGLWLALLYGPLCRILSGRYSNRCRRNSTIHRGLSCRP